MQRSARIDLIKAGTRTRAIKRTEEKKEQLEWKSWFLQSRLVGRRKSLYVKEEREARRDDWIAGPLAASRDIGKIRGAYGTVESATANPLTIPRQAQTVAKRLTQNDINDDGSVAPALAFKGRTILGNIAINDRVVVVEGPPKVKGLIGTIKSIGQESESVVLKDINIADVTLSGVQKAYASGGGKAVPLFETQELPVPTKDVRLVYDIEDPRTRQKKAVIIRHVHADGPYSARSPFSSWPSHSRYATGTGHLTRDGKDIRLDWPEEIPGEIPRRLDDDTSATNVEVKTWEPTIFTAPVGYPAETVQLKDGQQIEGPEGRYTAGVPVPESEEYRYFGQRVGIHGFSDEIKLEARQSKIAAGIMAELHGSGRVLKQDQTTHLKKKIMEDARAIWWKERQLLSPAAEAAKKAAEAKKERRETQLPKPTENDTDLVVDSALLESLQAAALKNRYNKADHRLRKRLSTANAAKNASKPAQEYGQFGEAERSWSINGDIVSENDQGAELGSSQRTAL